LGDLNVDGRIIFKFILKEWNGMDWIDLALYADKWWAVVSVMVKLLVPHSSDNILID
jgi:hypothetical protein